MVHSAKFEKLVVTAIHTYFDNQNLDERFQELFGIVRVEFRQGMKPGTPQTIINWATD